MRKNKTVGEFVTEFQKLERARKLALEYSRKVPMRACSPYGQLIEDGPAIMEAFRLCYEELSKRRLDIEKEERTGGRVPPDRDTG